ncbi:hypothetical protein ACA910_005870 [Epithemia clementina (nom. ined.)]
MEFSTRTPNRHRRHFGAILSSNESTPNKQPQQQNGNDGKKSSRNNSSTTRNQYTVSFEPGPIGLELEPGTLPQSGGIPCCRVQRFVDGGPKAPGPARASGSIQPGDVVVAVNGSPVKTYDQAIAILKQSSNRRQITFQSAWSNLPTPPPRVGGKGQQFSKDGMFRDSSVGKEDRFRKNSRSSSFDWSTVLGKSQRTKIEEPSSRPLERSVQKARSETWKVRVESDTTSHFTGDTLNETPKGLSRSVSLGLGEQYQSTPVNSSSPKSAVSSPLMWSSSTTRSFQSEIGGESNQEATGGEIVSSDLGITSEYFNKEELETQRKENEELKQALVNTRLELEGLRAERRGFQQADKENSELKKTITRLNENCSELKIQKQLLQERSQAYLHRITEAEESLKEASDSRSDLASELKQAQFLLQSKDKDLEEAKSESDSLLAKMDELRRDLIASKDDRRCSEHSETALSKELATSLEERRNLEQMLETTKKRLSRAENSLIELQSLQNEEREKSRGEIEKLQHDISVKDADFLKAKREFKQSIEAMQLKLEESANQAKKEVCSLGIALKQRDEAVQDADRTIEALQNQVHSANFSASQKLQSAYQEIEQYRVELRESGKTSEIEMSTLRVDLEQKEIDIQRLLSEIEELQVIIKEAKDSARPEIHSLQDALEAAHMEKKSLEFSLEQMKDLLTDTNECAQLEIKSLREDLARSQQQLNHADDKIRYEIQCVQEILHQEDEIERDFVGTRDVPVRDTHSFRDSTRTPNPIQNTSRDRKVLSPGIENSLEALASVREVFQQQQSLFHDLKTERDRLLDINEVMQETLDELCQERDLLLQKQKGSQHLSDQLEHKEKEINSLKKDLEQSEKAHAETRSKSKDVEDRLIERSVSLQTELSDRESELEAAQKELDFVRHSLKVTMEAKEQLIHGPSRKGDVKHKKAMQPSSWNDEAFVTLQTQLYDAKTEGKVLKRKIRSLEYSLSVVQCEKDEIVARKSQLTKDLYECKEKLGEKELQLLSRNMDSDMNCSEVEELEEKLAKTSKELTLSKRMIESLRQQCDDLNSRFIGAIEMAKQEGEAATLELIESQDDMTKLKQTNADMEKSLLSVRRDLEKAEERATMLRQKLVAERNFMAAAKEKCEEERKGLQQRIVELQAELESKTKEAGKIGKDSVQWKQEINQMKEHMDILKQEKLDQFSNFEARMKFLEHERDDLAHKLTVQGQEKLDAYRQLKHSKHEHERAQEELKALQKRFDEEQKLNQYGTDARSKQQAEIEKEKETCENLLSKTKQELSQAQSELRDTQEALQHSHDEVSKVTELLDNLKVSHTVKINELSEAHASELASVTEKMEQLRSGLQKAEEAEKEAARAVMSKDLEMATIKAGFIDLGRENKLMSEKLRENEESIEELQELIAQLREEYVDCSGTEDGASFFGLPRAELRALCQELRDQLTEVEEQLHESKIMHKSVEYELSVAQKRSTGLESEISCMSDEMSRVVNANSLLEKKVLEVEEVRRRLEGEAESLRLSLENAQHAKLGVEKALVAQVSLTKSVKTELEILRNDSETASKLTADLVDDLKQEINQLVKKVQSEEAKRERLHRDLVSMKEELLCQTKIADDHSLETKALEAQLISTKEQLSEREIDLERLREELDGCRARSGHDYDVVNAECSQLRKRMTELEIEAENLRKQVLLGLEKEQHLVEIREQLERASSTNEKLLEETAAKLSNSSKIVIAQNTLIEELQAHKLEAEKRTSFLSSQLQNLQDVVRKLEAASDATGEDYIVQMQQLETRNGQLSGENDELNGECAKLRDALRQTKRLCDEFRRTNGTLKKRVDQLKESYAVTKEEAHSAYLKNVELQAAQKKCQCDLESKQMELDHFKAKTQVLNATIARLKSDHILKPRIGGSSNDSKYGYQQPQEIDFSTHNEAVSISENIIGIATDVFNSLQSQLQIIDQCFHHAILMERFESLDLACVEAIRPSHIHGFLKEISLNILPQAMLLLDKNIRKVDSLTQLEVIGMSRKMRSNAATQTLPTSNTEGSETTMQLTTTIHSMEIQLSNLVADLKSANNALVMKDVQIAGFEKLLSNKAMGNLKDDIQEVSKLSNTVCSTADRVDTRIVVAGELIGRFFNGQELKRLNCAFRRWTALTSSSCAVEKQDAMAFELSHQLEATREKLAILKRHLKKSRRSPLTRILENEPSRGDENKIVV